MPGRNRSRSGSMTTPDLAARCGGAEPGHDQPGPGAPRADCAGASAASAQLAAPLRGRPAEHDVADGRLRVRPGDGFTVVILQIIDDCSRFDLALRAAPSENGQDIWAAVLHAGQRHGLPARFLTDNGGAFSGRRRGWISRLEENLRALNVQPITSSVAHPQTCGKNERAHSTVLKWLRKRPVPDTCRTSRPCWNLPRALQPPAPQDPPGRPDPGRALYPGAGDGPGHGPPWPVDQDRDRVGQRLHRHRQTPPRRRPPPGPNPGHQDPPPPPDHRLRQQRTHRRVHPHRKPRLPGQEPVPLPKT